MSKGQVEFRIVNCNTGRCLMGYASRQHAEAWLSVNKSFRVESQHVDSAAYGLHCIYVAKAQNK